MFFSYKSITRSCNRVTQMKLNKSKGTDYKGRELRLYPDIDTKWTSRDFHGNAGPTGKELSLTRLHHKIYLFLKGETEQRNQFGVSNAA